MKKVQSSMYVFTGRPYGIAYDNDIEDLNEILTEIAREHGEGAMREAVILNVLHDTRVNVFPLKYEAGELEFGEIGYRSGSEGVFRVEDYDKEFEDEDDLKVWLQRQVKYEELSLEDVRGLEITYIESSPGNYDDAEQTEGEWRIDVHNFEPKHREAMDAMACEYVDASEAENIIAELDKALSEARKDSAPARAIIPFTDILLPDVDMMSNEDLNKELFAMLDRVNEIQQEKRKREQQ